MGFNWLFALGSCPLGIWGCVWFVTVSAAPTWDPRVTSHYLHERGWQEPGQTTGTETLGRESPGWEVLSLPS